MLPVVYNMLQRAGIPEQRLLDSNKEIERQSFWADEVVHLLPLAEAAERAHRLNLAVPQSPRTEETRAASLSQPARPPPRDQVGGRVQNVGKVSKRWE